MVKLFKGSRDELASFYTGQTKRNGDNEDNENKDEDNDTEHN